MKLPRGFERQIITLDEARGLAKKLASTVSSSDFFPDVVVGIKYGGAIIGRVVADELKRPFHSIYVKRKPAIYIDYLVHRFPWMFKNQLVASVTRRVISKIYAVSKPHVIEPLKTHLPADTTKILIVDDSVGKGQTVATAKEHLVQAGIQRQNIKIGVLQVHPELLRESPDFFLERGNARFPWDKASIVESGDNPRQRFVRVCHGKTEITIQKNLQDTLLEQGIADPDHFINTSQGPITNYVGKGGRALVKGVPVQGMPDRMVIKRFRRSERYLLGKTIPEIFPVWNRGAVRSLNAAKAFFERGILTPEPIGIVEHRVFGFWKKSYLLTKEIPDLITFSRFLREEKNAQEKRRMVATVARAVREMHDAGLVHGDLTLVNIWIQSSPALMIYFGDLNRTRVQSSVSVKQRLGELARMNILQKPYISRSHRLLFWKEYSEGDDDLTLNEARHLQIIDDLTQKWRERYRKS